MIKKVIQVLPTKDFKVYVYFNDGKIKLYDASSFAINGNGVFEKISHIEDFIEKCTVINGTLAWDIGGNFNEWKCIDIDPYQVYEEGIEVSDPLEESEAS